MKKLTAGIFATILGVTAMGAADAAVTSKGYVDAALATKANASEVSTLSSTVSGHTTAIADLQTADTTLQNNINAVVEDVEALDGKVGTLPDTATATTVVGYVDEKTSGIASEGTVSALSEKVTALETASATHATKTELQTATNDMATQTWVKDQGYATSQGVTTVLADYATKTEAQGYANAKDAAIQAAQADATQALTDAENAQTAADAANAALNTASKLSDGQYALTMKVVDGVTSYGWELIDREYVSTDVTANGQ